MKNETEPVSSSLSMVKRSYDREIMHQLMMDRMCVKETHCVTTSGNVRDFFVENAVAANVSNLFCNEKNRGGSCVVIDDKELLTKIRGSHAHPIMKTLFSNPKQPIHLLFELQFKEEIHSFTIEKESDGKNTEWTVYQSHYELFTLSDWLGKSSSLPEWLNGKIPFVKKNPEDMVKELYRSLYPDFAQGKAVDRVAIEKFIDAMIEYGYKIPCESWMNIRHTVAITVYRISPSFLDRFIVKVKPPQKPLCNPQYFFNSTSRQNDLFHNFTSEKPRGILAANVALL